MQHWLDYLFTALDAADADVLGGGGSDALPVLTRIIVCDRLFDVYSILYCSVWAAKWCRTHIDSLARTQHAKLTKTTPKPSKTSNKCTSNRNSKPLELVIFHSSDNDRSAFISLFLWCSASFVQHCGRHFEARSTFSSLKTVNDFRWCDDVMVPKDFYCSLSLFLSLFDF